MTLNLIALVMSARDLSAKLVLCGGSTNRNFTGVSSIFHGAMVFQVMNCYQEGVVNVHN